MIPALALILVVLLLILWRLKRMSAATDGFTAAVSKLQTDVAALVSQGSSGTQAAVDAFATQATVQVQAIDNSVVAALAPPAAPTS